jgi:hypothetical protein
MSWTGCAQVSPFRISSQVALQQRNPLSYTKAELGHQYETEISVDKRNKET